jgi:hypothetical protein
MAGLIWPAVWSLCAVEIILRRPDMLIRPQPYAEDGPIFLQQQLFIGWHAVFTPYLGYYLFIPRVVTLLAVHLSTVLGQGLRLAPLFMNLAAIALAGLSASVVCRSRFNWIAPLWGRLILALLIVAVPASAEIYGNITNVQWWITVYQFFFMWDMFAMRRLPPWPDTAVLALASFSGPFGALPCIGGLYVIVADVLQGRRVVWPAVVKVALLIPGTALQLISLAASRFVQGQRGFYGSNLIEALIRVLFGNVFAQILLPNYPLLVNRYGFTYLIIGGIGFLLCIIQIVGDRWRLLGAPAVALCICLFAQFRGGMGWAEQYSYPFANSGGRYLFLPMAIILSVFVAGSSPHIAGSFRRALIPMFLGALIVVTDIRGFSLPPWIDYHWDTESVVYSPNGKSHCGVSIYPPGWITMLPCDPEKVRVKTAR